MDISPTITAAVVALAIALLVIALNWRRINIRLVRTLYGKYSFRYVKYFKDRNMKGPFSPCLKDDFITHIIKFFDKPNSAAEYKTNQNIQFGNVPFGERYKRVRREKGNPDCFNVSKIENSDLKIIGYRDSLFNANIKSVYYFLNNVFFMGEYLFSESSRDRIPEVAGVLCKKYTDKAANEKFDSFFIHDPHKSSIHFEDNGFNLSIKYFNVSNQAITETLQAYVKDSQSSSVSVQSEFRRELSDML